MIIDYEPPEKGEKIIEKLQDIGDPSFRTYKYIFTFKTDSIMHVEEGE